MNGQDDGDLALDMLFNTTTAPFQIISTDYENYSIVYSCVDYYWFDATEYIFIYTRDQTYTDSDFDKWNDIVQELVPSFSPLEEYVYEVIQGVECPYESRPDYAPTWFAFMEEMVLDLFN